MGLPTSSIYIKGGRGKSKIGISLVSNFKKNLDKAPTYQNITLEEVWKKMHKVAREVQIVNKRKGLAYSIELYQGTI
jgi:hypothetical protein